MSAKGVQTLQRRVKLEHQCLSTRLTPSPAETTSVLRVLWDMD